MFKKLSLSLLLVLSLLISNLSFVYANDIEYSSSYIETTINSSNGPSAKLPIYAENENGERAAIAVGIITLYYIPIDNKPNNYEIMYKVQSLGGLMGGFYATNLQIENTSVLNKQVYYTKPISQTFDTYTNIEYGYLGSFSAPSGTKVYTSSKGLKIYYPQHDYVISDNFNDISTLD